MYRAAAMNQPGRLTNHIAGRPKTPIRSTQHPIVTTQADPAAQLKPMPLAAA
jgi:hypothetical protein